MSYGIVYKITNTKNGKVYIGQTTKLLNLRWLAHVEAAKAGRKSKLANAILEFGPQVFKQEVIHHAKDKEELDQLEKEAIRFYRAQSDGYNTMSGGQHPPELSLTVQKIKNLAKQELNASEMSRILGIKEDTLFHAVEEHEVGNLFDFYHVEYDGPEDNSDQYHENSNADSLSVWEDFEKRRYELYTNYLESTR